MKNIKTCFTLSNDAVVNDTGVLMSLLSCSIISIPEVNKILDGDEESLDVKALRAVRVLRPLKLISGVPSKCLTISRKLLIPSSRLRSFTRRNKLG